MGTKMGLAPPFTVPKHLQVFADEDLQKALLREVGSEQETDKDDSESTVRRTCPVCDGTCLLLDDPCPLCVDDDESSPEWTKFWESASERATSLEPCGHHQPKCILPPSSEGG